LAVSSPSVTTSLERLVVAGVALTARALADASPGLELTIPQWRALVVIADPGGARVGEVSTIIGSSLPSTSRLLRRLVRRGLVTLARDESDHRATRARLTDRGRAVREVILSYRRARIRSVARSAEPTDELRHELARLAEAMSASV
jgi:DNA-binding MarR family transcriptional regulator